MIMKSVLIIQESLNGGGAEKVLTDYLNNFDYDKYNITLLLINRQGIYTEQINNNVVIKHIYKYKRPALKRLLSKTYIIDKIEKKEINKVLGDNKYDVIISFMEGISLKYHKYVMDRAYLNISWVHSNLYINSWSTKCFHNFKNEENTYRMLDKVIFVSQKAKEAFDQKYNVLTPEKIVLYNIINRNKIISLSNSKEIRKQKFTICNVGRLSPIKRQDRLIKAVKILIEKGCDIDLWIIGTGNEKSNLERLVKSLNIENFVHFLGFIVNPYPYIKAADIFVLSSDTEGYPTVICEALCLGKPIVSTQITGCTELLGDNQYGILTELDEQSLANGIYDLYTSKEKIIYFKNAAIRKSNDFSIENTIKEFYSIIDC